MEPLEVVHTPHHRRHDPPFELNAGQVVAPVWERPERIDAIERSLRDAGHHVLAPAAHDDTAITAVHDPAMVAWLRDAHDRWRLAGGPEVMIADTFSRALASARYPAHPLGQLGWWCTDTATPLVAGTWQAARSAVDVALTAADRVVDGSGLAYALVRPPGHHAGPDHFGGFCVLNVAAITAQHLTTGGRVAILDVDYHHGNGTQDVFWRRDDVLYVSLHADPATAYPYATGHDDEVGEGPGRGATLNVPLPPDTTPATYLAALAQACDRIAAWGATALVVSLGFDTFHADPIAGLGLDTPDFRDVGAAIRGLGLPTVLVQEGGYAIEHLGPSALALLSGLRPA